MIVDEWELMCISSGYYATHTAECDEMIHGIMHGINIGFEGERNIIRTCSNLPSATDTENARQRVTQGIISDVENGKKAGPYDQPPFKFYSLSPIGAVPKRGSDKLRIINHLSYPFKGDSINASTMRLDVHLGSFTQACNAVRRLGRGCQLIKLDVEAAYKQVPVRSADWPLLCFKWEGKYYHEVCLPFGLSSSCAKWELYASAMHHFFCTLIGIGEVVHYIDDFLFVIASKVVAHSQLAAALKLCVDLGVPMSPSKTEGPTTLLTFLGIEIDTLLMIARLSPAKLSEFQSTQ